MYALTAKQMKDLDASAINDWQIPAILLMEHAALALYSEIAEHYNKNAKILIVCGAGNNGGDGLALTRLLLKNGYSPTIAMLTQPEKLSELSTIHYHILKRQNANIVQIVKQDDLTTIDTDYNLIVDAIFGVSLNRPVEGLYATVIDWINQQNAKILAVDVPSGIDATSGKYLATAVKADLTVTFAAAKCGLYLYPAADYVGQLVIADIGIPQAAYQQLADSQRIIEVLTADCLILLAKRSANTHKGSYGKALIIAGSNNMAGAALLAAKAAYKTGAGLVCVLTDCANQTALNSYLPEAICHGYRADGNFEFAIKQLKEQADKANCLLIGPGLSTEPIAQALVKTALTIDKPLIIDADGLNILSENEQLFKQLKSRSSITVLTPHIGEMARLTKLNRKRILDDPLNIAKQFATEHNVILVLKSARTIIAQPNGQLAINIAGNNGMATAGSGDVLAGAIAGLLANKANKAADAVNAAVFLHATAGDKAALKTGKSGLIASDIIDMLKAESLTVKSKRQINH